MAFRNLSLFSNKSSDNQVKSKPALHSELQLLIDNPTSIDASWVESGRSETGYIFVTESLEINADFQTVRKQAEKVKEYHRISGGALTAKINGDGELKPGNTIKLELYKDKWIGKFIPAVTETIIVAGEVNNKWIIGWGSPNPFGGGLIQRYQIIEALPDNKTKSTIGDKIPGIVGFFSHLILDKVIKNAFKDFNEGLKREVEAPKRKI